MLFNSYQFLIFFPIITALYFLLPHKMRWAFLLLASCVFYMAFIPVYIFILLVTISIDYFLGIQIEKTEDERKRRGLLVLSIISTCAVLFVFKYFNFFNTNAAIIGKFFHLNYPVGILQLALPIGLSFHTFQSLSYVVEVYRKRQKAEHHFGIYSLYVMFYPQLVSGPIERPQHLLHQFYEEHYFDYERVTDGLKLMAWGMFKKIVIADRLSSFVSSVYGKPTDYQGISFIVATFFFAFQIYCDFSGYSDIAIGAAQVMGFRLMCNFNRPYFAQSIAEFWRRWHISLSTWFRDYVYIPLGGNRVHQIRWYYNLLITFLISGLWHGANWTYIVWGAMHGFFMAFGALTVHIRQKITGYFRLQEDKGVYPFIQRVVTFLLVCFAWIFFRAKNIADAWYIVRHLFAGVPDFFIRVIHRQGPIGTGMEVFQPVFLGHRAMEFCVAVVLIIFLIAVEIVQRQGAIRIRLAQQPVWVRWGCYCSLMITMLIFGYFDISQQFIYFQF